MAPGLFPSGLKDCWCFPGAASWCRLARPGRHPTMLGAKPRKGTRRNTATTFFGIADASRFKERSPNQRLFTCSYPRADFDISLLMGLCLGNWHCGHRILLLTKHWLPLTPTVGNRPNAPLYALWPTSLVGLDTPRYHKHRERTLKRTASSFSRFIEKTMNISTPKPFHTKRPHRKSRAGCRNCKTRKV